MKESPNRTFVCVMCRRVEAFPESDLENVHLDGIPDDEHGMAKPFNWGYGDLVDLWPNVFCPPCYGMWLNRPRDDEFSLAAHLAQIAEQWAELNQK